MTLLRAATLALTLLTAAAAAANERADRLLDALSIGEVIGIMQAEGLAYSDTLATDMLPGGPTDAWREDVARIYRTEAMETAVRRAFAEALGAADVDAATAFFESDRGRRIIALELGARRALADDGIEEAARQTYRDMAAGGDPALEPVAEFIEVNDLIEQNVVGALNSNVAFFRGLVEGGGMEMSEDEILSDVWSSEAETREDTTEWLYAFLMMAYQPLEPGDMDAYLALSRTEGGQALNRALFAAFDRMYVEMSYGLGLALARAMGGQDI